MERIKRYIYCALIALLCISCSKEEDSSLDSSIPKTVYAQAPIFESRAVFANQPESWGNSETVDSRTYAVVDPNNTNEYFQYWSDGDAISLFFTTANLKYQIQNYNVNIDEGVFELVGTEVQGTPLNTQYYYSVYPYKTDTQIMPNGLIQYNFPETQHYNRERYGDSYANGENGMIALEPKETDGVYHFQNFCSYLQLRFSANGNQSKKVKKITLTTNKSDEKITGIGGIMFRNNEPTVTMMKNTTNKITLDCGSGVELSTDNDNPTKFWFVLPGAFTFTQGFSITAIFEDNTYFKLSTSKKIGILRNHIKPMATVEPTPITPTGPIRYKYHDTSITEPFPLNNTFYGEDGKSLDIIAQIFDEQTQEWVVLLSGELKTIGSNSFENPRTSSGTFDTSYPDIESITINCDNKISLADFAFYDCTAETLSINSNVETIGQKVVNGSNINNVTFAQDIKIDTIKQNAFLSHDKLTTINLNKVKVIEDNAFYKCVGLTTISLDEVEKIGIGAFQNCTSLEGTLILPATLKEIGEGAFNSTLISTVYCYALIPPTCNHDNNEGDAYIFPSTALIYVSPESLWDYPIANGWWYYTIYPME